MTKYTPLAFIFAALVLTSCGDGLRDTLGIAKKRPNEFNVLTNPPLILPPDFNLRPPGSGNRPISLQGRELAKAIVLPTAPNTQELDASEKTLLDKASDGNNYGDGIREQLENDRRGTISRPADEVSGLVAPNKIVEANADPYADCKFLVCF